MSAIAEAGPGRRAPRARYGRPPGARLPEPGAGGLRGLLRRPRTALRRSSRSIPPAAHLCSARSSASWTSCSSRSAPTSPTPSSCSCSPPRPAARKKIAWWLVVVYLGAAGPGRRPRHRPSASSADSARLPGGVRPRADPADRRPQGVLRRLPPRPPYAGRWASCVGRAGARRSWPAGAWSSSSRAPCRAASAWPGPPTGSAAAWCSARLLRRPPAAPAVLPPRPLRRPRPAQRLPPPSSAPSAWKPPCTATRRPASAPSSARYGEQDSLGYFATRRDKAVVFSPSGKAAVTYRVEAGVCLASGDPVGDREAWPHAIAAWLDVGPPATPGCPAVMGASEEGAKAFARAGSARSSSATRRSCTSPDFDLDGRDMRVTRQAVQPRPPHRRRPAASAATPPSPTRRWSRSSTRADAWRDTETERGFSMALDRLGDPADGDCLLVEALDAGRPAARPAVLRALGQGRHLPRPDAP